MNTTIEVARALVNAGYLTEADIQAAAALLDNDTNVIPVVEAQQALVKATRDKDYQDQVLANAIAASNVDLEMGAYQDREHQQDVIKAALDQQDQDFTIIAAARETIAAASQDAAVALLAAELIDEADLEAVAEMINDLWVMEAK